MLCRPAWHAWIPVPGKDVKWNASNHGSIEKKARTIVKSSREEDRQLVLDMIEK